MQRCNDETKGGHTGYMPMPDSPMSDRVKVGTSHNRFSYWLDHRDLYVYQYDDRCREWIGWLCSLDVWERTFGKAKWVTLEISPAVFRLACMEVGPCS